MELNKIRTLLEDAKAFGFQQPSIPDWAKNTELEQQLLRSVSTKVEIEQGLLSLISGDPDFDCFNGRMWNQGRGYVRVELKTILNWLLYMTNKVDVETALSALTKFSKIKYMPVQEFLAISGVAVSRSIELGEAVRLVPFNDIPSSFAKESLDPALMKPEFLVKFGISPGVFTFLNHVPPKAVIIKAAKVEPKYKSPSDNLGDFLSVSAELYEICECITLISSAAPLPIVNWVTMDEWVPCSGFVGGGFSPEIVEVKDKTIIDLTDNQLYELKALYGQFCSLDQKTRNRLRIPIQRLNQARRRTNIADKAIDIGVALEALYLNDHSSKDQISFTFRLRAAWYLGDNHEHRKELIENFNKIYGCRSKAVHTGKLDEYTKMKRGKIKTADLLNKADVLCVQSILRIINDSNYPNWETLILGAN